MIGKSAGREGTDWPLFLQIAETNEIAPFVYRGLTGEMRAGIPPEVLGRLEDAYTVSSERNLILRAEFLRVLKSLRARGVEVVPYKEPLVFSLLCPDVGMRRFKDVDFLVAGEDIEATAGVLEDLGYRLEQSKHRPLEPGFELLDKDCSFVRESDRITGRPLPDSQNVHNPKFGWLILEPHWSVTHPRLNVDLPVQELKDRARSLSFEGEPINVLSVEDALLVACIVGSKSEWRSLKLVADVCWAIDSSADLDWQVCLERATRVGARRMFLVGCCLAERVGGTAIPVEIRRAAMDTPVLVRLLAEIEAGLGDHRVPARVDPCRFSLRMLRLRERPRDRWTYIIDTLTGPSGLERRLNPLHTRFPLMTRFFVPFVRYLALPLVRRVRPFLQRNRVGSGVG